VPDSSSRSSAALLVALLATVPLGPVRADPPPEYRGEWGPSGTEPGQLTLPFGIDIDAHGVVFVADTDNHRVQTFDRQGVRLGGWGTLGTGPGEFDRPIGIAVDDSDYVYVVDSRNSRVEKFTAAGAFVTAWGTVGEGPGQFTGPFAVAVGPAGAVYVTDPFTSRVEKFTAGGSLLLEWGATGAEEALLSGPRGIATDAQGNVYVTSFGSQSVGSDWISKFTADGQFLRRWGGFNSQPIPGTLHGPIGIDIDSAGNVYVADHFNYRMQKFSANGDFLAAWGVRGAGPNEFIAVNDLAVDDRDDVFVIDLGHAGQIVHFSYHPAQVAPSSWSRLKDVYRGRAAPAGGKPR
jgi:DNA-binding beta-propeller fold protein YncE